MPTLMLLIACLAPIPPGAALTNHYLPAQRGNKWIYQQSNGADCTFSVTDSYCLFGATVATISTFDDRGATGHWQKFLSSAAGVSLIEDDSFFKRKYPAICWLKADAKLGETWKYDTWLHIGVSPIPCVGRIQYMGTETLRLPIGEVEAFHAKALRSPACIGGDRWYAKGIGMVQYSLGEGHMLKLKRFIPAEK